MISLVVHAHRILTPHEELHDRVILIQDGRITAIGHRDEIQVPADARDIVARDTIVVPGFIDIHIHGAGGRDVMEATPAALSTIAERVARHGTTSLLATTVSASPDETCRLLAGIAEYIASPENRPSPHRSTAEILGIHLEGPFISAARRGVHPESALEAPSIPLLEKFLAAASGTVRILTIAPELPGARRRGPNCYNIPPVAASTFRGTCPGDELIWGMAILSAQLEHVRMILWPFQCPYPQAC